MMKNEIKPRIPKISVRIGTFKKPKRVEITYRIKETRGMYFL